MAYNMSPAKHERTLKKSKFTRGEKCIFTHIVVTFVLILSLVIIYFVHLCLVSHKGNDIFEMTRRQYTSMNEGVLIDYEGLGLVFLKTPIRAACNALLVQKRWSIAPGFCVAARSEPHLSAMLPFWKIKYRNEGIHGETGIIRSVTHPHFNNDDLNNNIGLFEHEAFSNLPLIPLAATPGISIEDVRKNNMGIVSWSLASNKEVIHNDVIVRKRIQGPIKHEDCSTFVSPITDLRGHEFCVVMGKENNDVLVHGAPLLYNSNYVLGYFSWGLTRSGEVPIVILNITYFKDWIEYITT